MVVMRKNRTIFVCKAVHCLIALAVCGFSGVAGISAGSAQPAGSAADGRLPTDRALLDIRHNIVLSQQRAALLADEVRTLRKDRKTLTEALVKAAKAEREFGQDIRVSEDRLRVLVEKKHVVEKAFKDRRREFSTVLAALERMGFNPPPALLVHADDALQSVRSAVLLGSIVPEIRMRTEMLAADLKELEMITKSVRAEGKRLADAVENRQAEKKRLSLLLAEKARLQKESEENLVAEEKHNRELVEKAKSLQELFAELHRQSKLQTGTETRDRLSLMQIQTDFAALQGLLPLPVDGRRVQTFGQSSHGEVIETESGAVVTAPVEGIVRYAGTFRSYGRLLIIDAGGNYHLVLAGLGRIDVAQGQMLLQGEPVGVMGAQLVASTAAFDVGKSLPMLYIEFRKDGKPVNPALWWARR